MNAAPCSTCGRELRFYDLRNDPKAPPADVECSTCQRDGPPPVVCPGCYAVGEERCAPGCIDAEMEREREAAERYEAAHEREARETYFDREDD